MATSWYLFISVWFISHQNHRVVIQEWSLSEPLTLLQSMNSGSEPPDKQYLSTIFKFFSKDSFWLKFDERKSSVLYTTFIGWFNGVNLFRRLSCNHNVFQYQGIFLHLNTLYCKYLFLNFKSYFILPISFTLNLLLWKLVCIEGKFQLSVSRYTNDLIFKETI